MAYISQQPRPGPAQALKDAFQGFFGAFRAALGMEPHFNPRGRTSPVPDSQWPYAGMALRQDRRSVIDDVKRGVVTDPRLSVASEMAASDATIGGCKIVLKNSESTADATEIRADGIIQGVMTRLDILGQLEDFATRLPRDGDLFGQILLDAATGEITGLSILDASITYPCKDNRGRWEKGPEYAYYQTDGITDTPTQWFAEWEVVHVKWRGGKADLVGQSQFRTARKSFNILEKSEEDLAIRRRVRTGLKFHHAVGTTWEDVEEYKKKNDATLKKPFDVTTDFFSTFGNVAITPLGGDQGIGELGDISLFIDNIFARARVPKALAGYESNISSDILVQQMLEFERYLGRINGKIDEFLRGIFSRALLFAGINDEAIEYAIVWAPKTEESLDSKIARVHILRVLGLISMETALRLLDIPTVDWSKEKQLLLQEMEDFPVSPFSLASGRPGLPNTMAEVYSMYPWLAPPELQNKIMPPEPAPAGGGKPADSKGDAAASKSSSSNGNGKRPTNSR